MRTIRVVIAEDHPMFREGLAAALSAEGFDVVATAGDGQSAREAVERYEPDVLVLDLEMPGEGGLAVLAGLNGAPRAPRTVVLSSHDDDANVYAALRGGAVGYLLKSSPPDGIIRAVRAVAHGQGVFDSSVMARITKHFATGSRSSRDAVFPQLSPREREVLSLVADGRSNESIADHFVVSVKTVRNQVSMILAKLDVATRAEALLLARQRGLGSDGS